MTETAAPATPTPTAEVAVQDTTPAGLIKQYTSSFAAVLPSHIKAETWVRLAQGALKRGKRITERGPEFGKFELEVAATNNPGLFLATLLDAARLGLEPGTELFYLTPRKVRGKLEILGIIGYQGHIELMYRGGGVVSIVAEAVYSRDQFAFRPGRDNVPQHDIDWDSDDRGELRLVYAFARMRDGATSKVVVLNKAAIARIKISSAGSGYDSSPWKVHEESMWVKSAVRQLQKWVPTSAEYRREQQRADAAFAEQLTAQGVKITPDEVRSIREGGYEAVLDGEIVDQEFDEEGWLATQDPANERVGGAA
jgi:recombination protein RecT